jgi:hypothetical protein
VQEIRRQGVSTGNLSVRLFSERYQLVMKSQPQTNAGNNGNCRPLCSPGLCLAHLDVVCCVAANMRRSHFSNNVLTSNVELIPRRKHTACMIKTKWLMLLREITAINSGARCSVVA